MDWNQEIKLSDVFKRKPQAEEVDETLGDLPTEEKPREKASFLKKELKFGRKTKEPKQPKEPKPPKEPKQRREWRKRKQATDGAAPAAPKAKKPKAARGRKDQGPKRAKRLVGLKIGGSQLAAARIANNGAPELVQLAREDLEPGLVVSGELREPELLADALRSFFRKNGLPRQGIRLGIANNRIGVRVFEIAGIDDPRQLENAIRFRAQEVLPIPIEEAVLDYHVLGDRVGEEG